MGGWKPDIGTARLFEPEDRLVDMGLQQMGFANTEIPIMERWVPRTEPDGLLLRRDRVLDLPDVGQRSRATGITGQLTRDEET